MKQGILLATFSLAICISVFAQKLAEPKLLGNWFAGEDPSEFILHLVMEFSQELLKENPEGKLIVRICSSDEFLTAFIKAPLNPLSASQYNRFRLLVPNEKIFIARSSKCLGKGKYIYNQYWFVPAKNTLEYEEIFPVNSISYKNFGVYELENYDKTDLNNEFDENLKNFIGELKSRPNSDGFIIQDSRNRKIKHDIEKVKKLSMKEGVDVARIRTIAKVQLEPRENGKLSLIKDKNSFPTLAIIEIKK